MSTSYVAKSPAPQAVQLKVQELTLTLNDTAVLSNSGTTATLNLGENVSEVRTASFTDDSAGTGAPVVASNRTISGSIVTLTLSAAMAVNDAITIRYVTTK